MTGLDTGVRFGDPRTRTRRRAVRLIRRFPVTFLGCVSFALLLGGVAAIDLVGQSAIPPLVVDAWRVLAVPAYLATLAASEWGFGLLGGLGAPPDWHVPLGYGLRLAPFLLADFVLALARGVARR